MRASGGAEQSHAQNGRGRLPLAGRGRFAVSVVGGRDSNPDRRIRGWYFCEPKTSQSRRTIPLPTSLVKALTQHKRRQAETRLRLGSEYQTHDLVFATSKGGPLHPGNLNARNFKAVRDRAKLPSGVTLYTLRHTCATLLLLAGEERKSNQRAAGA